MTWQVRAKGRTARRDHDPDQRADTRAGAALLQAAPEHQELLCVCDGRDCGDGCGSDHGHSRPIGTR